MSKVFTNGCFDILHRGHMELLKFCRQLAQPSGTVIVGLNSDQSVRALKGNSRPIFNEVDRKFMLESCIYVDEVMVFNEPTPYNLIKSLKPDTIVKGGDYKASSVVGADLCDIRIFNYIDGYSTTTALKRGQ